MKTVDISSKVLPDKKREIDAMAKRYKFKWKAAIDHEMAYTLITGSDRMPEEDGGDKKTEIVNITDIAGKKDMLSDLDARDVDSVKEIISQNVRGHSKNDLILTDHHQEKLSLSVAGRDQEHKDFKPSNS